MSNQRLFCVLILALVPGFAAMAAPAAGTEAKSSEEVLQREHQYTAAVLHGDARLLASVLADSFMDTSESGVLRSKPQLLQIISGQKPPTSITETQRKIQIYGDAAVVTVRFVEQGVDQGKPYKFVGRATDFWIKRDGAWYCVAAHSSGGH